MALTPIDVQQKTFGTALRGYDLDEVDDFLDDVVTSLKGYEQRLAEAQERISGLEAELADKGDSESAISRALVAAQRSADMIVEEAKAEADRILGDAREQSELLAASREEERAKLDVEVAGMRSAVSELREKMRTLAASIESDLDEMDGALAGAEGELVSADLPPEPVAVAAVAVASAASEPAPEADTDSPVAGGREVAAVDAPEAMSSAEVAVEEDTLEPEPVSEPAPESPPVPQPEPSDELDSSQLSWGAATETQPRTSVDQWTSSWTDDLDLEAALPVPDPLEEALAEASFADVAVAELADDAEEPADSEPVDDDAAEVPTADALHSDESGPGDAWERAGLEGWADDASGDEDDRPRRPWE